MAKNDSGRLDNLRAMRERGMAGAVPLPVVTPRPTVTERNAVRPTVTERNALGERHACPLCGVEHGGSQAERQRAYRARQATPSP